MISTERNVLKVLTSHVNTHRPHMTLLLLAETLGDSLLLDHHVVASQPLDVAGSALALVLDDVYQLLSCSVVARGQFFFLYLRLLQMMMLEALVQDLLHHQYLA